MSQESMETQAFSVVESASDCGNHPITCEAFTKDDIAQVLAYRFGCSCKGAPNTQCDTYCDRWSFAAMRLKNGKYVVAQEWSDTSGHG